ncbi:ATP-binding protein [Streptomyces sp. NPDC057680]|uniref:ATP-binding protein n=1 Tax=Streptomyces sp. NPDC057680 TaxID=3346208 RepID=UPI00368B57A5
MSREDAAAPHRLRRILRASLNHWGRPHLVDTAELLLTELVTNALKYASAPTVNVRISQQSGHLRIEVNDNTPGGPLPRTASLYAEHGRGLLLVDAMAESWGVSEDRATVWCMLPLTEGTPEMAPATSVLHETLIPLTPNANAATTARISARSMLTIMAWPGPHDAAVDVLYVLVRNAVEHGLTEESTGQRLGVWLRINENHELLIDVQDHLPDFPCFDEAVRGELGRGLWGAQSYGAVLSWTPNDQGKIVRATLQPGPVNL